MSIYQFNSHMDKVLFESVLILGLPSFALQCFCLYRTKAEQLPEIRMARSLHISRLTLSFFPFLQSVISYEVEN